MTDSTIQGEEARALTTAEQLTVRRLQAVAKAGFAPRPDAAHIADVKDALALIERLAHQSPSRAAGEGVLVPRAVLERIRTKFVEDPREGSRAEYGLGPNGEEYWHDYVEIGKADIDELVECLATPQTVPANAELSGRVGQASTAMDVLMSLSSYVGAGLGDENTTPDQYEQRIRWGIDHLCSVASAKGSTDA